MTQRLFVDTAPLLYAVGGAHPLRAPCRSLLAAAAEGEVELHASVEAVQEFLFHRLRRDDRGRAAEAARAVRHLVVLHPFDAEVADLMLDIVESSQLGGRDAVHAATAFAAGFDQIVSTDSDLDGVPGLRRVTPEEVVAGSLRTPRP